MRDPLVNIPMKMKLSAIDKLLDDIMQNYPEASFCVHCVGWDYTNCVYKFLDPETGKHYTLKRPKLRKALVQTLKDLFNGKYPGIAQYVLQDFKDACNWDADATDVMVQTAIFGEAIYG